MQSHHSSAAGNSGQSLPPEQPRGGSVVASNPFDDSAPSFLPHPMGPAHLPPEWSNAMQLRGPRNPFLVAPPPSLPALPRCPRCFKEFVNPRLEEPLICGTCHSVYHRTCVGMTEAAYSLLSEAFACEPVVGWQIAEWVCEECIAQRQIPMLKWSSCLPQAPAPNANLLAPNGGGAPPEPPPPRALPFPNGFQ